MKIHAVIEEEIFYPTVRKHVGLHIMNEADEEHHLAKVLNPELDLNGGGGGHREAKFTVLAESVRHHIKKEENEMLPKSKELDIDFEALGQKMLDRKTELKNDGVPKDAMVAEARVKGYSPAANARKSAPSARKTAHKTGAERSRTSKGGSSHASH